MGDDVNNDTKELSSVFEGFDAGHNMPVKRLTICGYNLVVPARPWRRCTRGCSANIISERFCDTGVFADLVPKATTAKKKID